MLNNSASRVPETALPSKPEPAGEVTRLLLAWNDGEATALADLMPLVEGELRRIAGRYFRGERKFHTLQPTALVNEVYMRLVGRHRVRWQNRAHFFGFAAQLMRRLLVDHARIAQAAKRGDGKRNLTLDEISGDPPAMREPELIALDDALKSLATVDARQSQIVELRYFGGLKSEEIGEVLGVSSRTVRREWRTARLWLRQELGGC